jgi:hypothetical protein
MIRRGRVKLGRRSGVFAVSGFVRVSLFCSGSTCFVYSRHLDVYLFLTFG